MSRIALIPLVICVAWPVTVVHACTFCGGELRSKQTLRMHYAAAKVVLHGQLKNPRFDSKTDEAFTDLRIGTALKDDPARAGQEVITLRTYLPVIGDTPPEYLVFCAVKDGKIDPTFGVPATALVVEYLKGVARLDATDPVAKLEFYYNHIESADATVSADAFFEFARAPDSEILKAAKKFDPVKLRRLLDDNNTPAERIGVFAFLLGVAGGPDDAAYLAGLLAQRPLPERISGAFGGLLAGYILLTPKEGWAFTEQIIGDVKQPYAVRLSAISTVRFFQATNEKVYQTQVLKCCAALLGHGDLADQAIEDLRRWGYWELTPEVLSQYSKPSHSAPIVRRAIVRYALCCPREDAKRFIASTKQTDPKLVAIVEESLELLAPVTPVKKTP